MVRYFVRRLVWLIPVMVGVTLLTFFLMHAVPGGPWDSEKRLAPEAVQNLNQKYGTDDPLWEQYGRFLGNVLHGDLGISYTYQDRSVVSILREGLPKTATIGLLAFACTLLIGIPLGMIAAVKRNSWADYLALFFSTNAAAIPSFVLAFGLILLFSVHWRFLPTSGWGMDRHLILPVVALAALPTAVIARITRAAFLDALQQDYVRTAWSKGLSGRVVYLRHVLKNALIPVVTIAGPELAGLIAGSFIIEQVFAIPGIGRLFVQGVGQRDYGLIMGTVLFYAALIAVVNLAVDMLYAALNPRIRYE